MFEWYPTTKRMIDAVAGQGMADVRSILDVGAGDGRVLHQLAASCEGDVKLYAIEKSTVLVQAQPDNVIPVGTDLCEQNLSCLKVDVIFSNPPYRQFEAWACTIIETGFAHRAYLIVPRRWKDSALIRESLRRRGASVKVIHSDDFHDAERRARAVVDVLEVRYPRNDRYWDRREPQDPFDAWFDQNISTFDEEKAAEDSDSGNDVAKRHACDSIGSMVAAFNEEYARMEDNYRAIFKLDYALLNELGVKKDAVREGIKQRMAGLKTKYWKMLFDRLDTITGRLSTATRKRFLEKLTNQTAVAFTATNAYAVVLWAIKNANKYYNEQLVQLFKDLSTFDGVMNYKSNQQTWDKTKWRFMDNDPTHYALDYRIVVVRHDAICAADSYSKWNYPGNLSENCHELIADIIAVFANLGFFASAGTPSRDRTWSSNEWQDWRMSDDSILFQAKAFKNGNVHLRMKPEAIKALNVEAGRLMGWIRDRKDVVAELGYTEEDATRYFGASRQIAPASVKLLTIG